MLQSYMVPDVVLRVQIAASPLPAPLLTYQVQPGLWRLEQDYPCRDEVRGHLLVVPAGFLFDLSSVPRAAWWLIAPFELSIVAPLLHDYVYRQGGVIPVADSEVHYSRTAADELFRDLMTREGVPRWRRQLAYPTVRLFGWTGWQDWDT